MSDERRELGAGPPPYRPARVLVGLTLFGLGFGFVEAVVVVDLRAILGPSVDRIYGRPSDDRLPMIAFERVRNEDPSAAQLLRIEVMREAATLVLLAGVGLAAGRSGIGRFSAFVVGFGVWDLAYYLSLKWLIGWPATVWTWDILFLIPVPWAAPVLAPALVAATMVVAGSFVIVEESSGRPFRVSRGEWVAIVSGGLILVTSFCWDWRRAAAGDVPAAFPWTFFFLGQALSLGGFVHAVVAVRQHTSPSGIPA